MKVYLIKASAQGPFKEYKKAMGAPPQNIFSVAAATPEGVDIQMCDETIDMKPDFKTDADIVGIFFHTPDAPHSYRLAEKFKAKGKTVVLGGLHPTFFPVEAVEHSDSVLIGEAEGIWEDLINDYKTGSVKKTYQRESPVDLATVNPYPTDIIPPAKYDHIWTVLVSRGCVHKCEYCTVPPFFCGKYRLRPVGDIVAEIKAAPTDYFELHADNLTADRDYALQLFKALKPLNIKWSGEATIKLADDEELLKAAAESGCNWLLIGIETPSQSALKETGKGFVDPDSIKEKIARFHEYDIHVTSSMIFGFDTHSKDIFEESERFCRFIGIDEVESVILIPFPGTPLYDRIDSEGRLLTKDWSKFDGSNAVFRPANMTPEELEEGAAWFWKEIQKKKPGRSKTGCRGSGSGPSLTSRGYVFRWKSILALCIIALGLYFNWYWIWGALLLVWGVQDIRSRRTYLLDDIPRSESPVLYWIVVIMWLTMGLWALSTSPVFADISERSVFKDKTIAMIDVDLPVKTDVKMPDSDIRRICNEKFNFSFQAPSNWSLKREIESDCVTYDLKNRKDTATITVIAFNYRTAVSNNYHIAYMEKELQKDLPFIKESNSGSNNRFITVKNRGKEMQIKKYRGKLDGWPVISVVGYVLDKTNGFSMVGVYGERDHRMEKQILHSLRSFRFTKE